jgi:hypothetical protein
MWGRHRKSSLVEFCLMAALAAYGRQVDVSFWIAAVAV